MLECNNEELVELLKDVGANSVVLKLSKEKNNLSTTIALDIGNEAAYSGLVQ